MLLFLQFMSSKQDNIGPGHNKDVTDKKANTETIHFIKKDTYLLLSMENQISCRNFGFVLFICTRYTLMKDQEMGIIQRKSLYIP